MATNNDWVNNPNYDWSGMEARCKSCGTMQTQSSGCTCSSQETNKEETIIFPEIKALLDKQIKSASVKEMEDVPYYYREMEQVIKSLLSTQEEKIFKQFETIDVKMGDPDAEAKVKFAIKAMVRHIKLKNATK